MGRGRAKAKQTKVARELKYSSPQTDFTQLQHELSHAPDNPIGSRVADEVPEEWAEEDDWRR